MKLTDQQINFFHNFGYLMIPQLFSPEEMAWVIEEYENVLQNHAAGDVHDGSRRTMIVPSYGHSERLCTLLDDHRILGIASGILGDDFNYGAGDANYYVGDTHWHPDSSWPELFAIKMTFYLDPMTPDTGCLRVIPGSHRIDSYWHKCLDPDWRNGRGHINLNDAEAVWGLPPSDIPESVALETNPGDLVFFNHTIFHASFGGGNRRRMFTLNLTKRGKTEAEIARVDEYLTTNCPAAHGFKIGGMYTDLTIDTATPERLRHMTQFHKRHAVVHPNDTIPRELPTL